VEGKPYYNVLKNNSATEKVILYPTVYGQRNAMACFLVTELSFTKQQFEHFVVKAKELEASYLCLINFSKERIIENRNAIARNLNKNTVNNTFRIEDFNLACYDIGRYPYSKCDIPQGPSALFLRKLDDKEKFRSLDEAIDKYIKTEKAKLENVHYKQAVIDWLLKTKFIVSKLFDEGSSEIQNLFYESLHSTLSNKLHAHPSTEMFVGVIVDFEDASRELAKFETQNIQLINIDNIILEKLRFISKSQFCLEALSLTSFIERDLALLSDAFVQTSQDDNFFALTERMTGQIETIKNEDQKTIFKLAEFVELQRHFEMINQ
jgi:ribosomal protein L17